MLAVTLTRLGHEVIIASNGQQAFSMFQAHTPAIVISDWMMPEMEGTDLCRQIRTLKLDHYTYFILITSKDRHEEFLEAMEAGVDDFLRKPLNAQELAIRLRVVERILRQREQAERQIRLLARFPSDNPNPILQIDRESRVRYANAAGLGLLIEWNCGIGEAAPANLHELVELIRHTGERHEIEVGCADRVYSFSATSVSPDGVTYLYGHDITDRKRAENELLLLKNQAEEHALHDQLTGLPNRRLLSDRLNHETARALRLGHKLALVIADIDHFKQINDGYGHKLGDQVIVTVGQCLQEQLRSTDTVCRWGGDELVLLLTDIRSTADVAAICSKLMQAVKKRAVEAGITAPLSLSMGSAIVPDDTADPSLLMQQADHALYIAKADGRDRWQPFTGFPDKHDAKAQADLFLRLKSAITQERIAPFYQPIVDTSTGQVVGAEALARWHDAQSGWVPPDVFIPLAEEKGLIIKLGEQVLSKGLEQLSEWHSRGYSLTLALNLSKRQVLDANFAPNLIAETARRKLEPSWITLEIIERESVIDHALGRQRLKALSDAGFRLAVDDFGSGYSSFELVGAMPFDELKIDMGLVRRIQDAKGRRIVRAIVEMGKALDLSLVAEGVETEEVRAILAELGVQKIQGYLFSKPLPAEAFLTYLAANRPALTRDRAA